METHRAILLRFRNRQLPSLSPVEERNLVEKELKKEFAVDEPDWADSSIKHCLRRERSLDHRVLCSIRLLLIQRHCCLYLDNVQCLCDQDGLCYCESGPHIGFYYITLDCALLMFCWLTLGQFL